MKRNLAALLLLVGLAGCGALSDTQASAQSPQRTTEMVIVPNFAANSLTVKQVNQEDGTTRLVGDPVPSAGTHPVIVKAHPNVKVFYVVNRDSNVITQFSLDDQGKAGLISSIACPERTQLLVVHPSGGWAYAAGGTRLRTYSISSTGILNVQGVDTELAAEPGWGADFSHNGKVLHVPELGQLQSFPISRGALGSGVTTPLAGSTDRAVDLDLKPGSSCLEVVVQGNDSVSAYTLGSDGFPSGVTVQHLKFRPATGDFAQNGQYYLGENGAPAVHVYQVGASGLLSERSDSPMALTGTGGAFFTALDLTENFVLSTDANPNNRLDIRLRQADGKLAGSLSDSQSLNIPGQFDFMLFLEP